MKAKKTKKIKINSLYIHIPFCKNICPYCDFVKMVKNKEKEDLYIEELIKDISKIKDKFYKFETLYIGGGTPSILSRENLEKLLSNLSFLKKRNSEFTIECNPEDIDEQLLKLLKKYGINRISIGIQSFNKRILEEIDRDYDIDYFNLIKLVKKYIKNINVDLIYGFKNQTLEELNEDLTNFIKLDINHLSIYSLIVEEGSIFYLKKYPLQNEDDSRLFYDLLLNRLRENGYERYEVSNFAKNKKYSRHNLNYWLNKPYLAIGISASGYIDNYRYKISPSINKYLSGRRDIEKEELNEVLKEEYFLLTNLRLERGFSLKKYQKNFKNDFLIKYKNIVEELKKDSLITINKGYFKCTDKGLIILDFILLKLFKNI